MLRKKYICWIILIAAPAYFCQVQLTDYKESKNRITLNLSLDEADWNHYDESRPGEIYLQKRNILIALPFKQEPQVTWTVKAEKRYRKIPVLNPQVTLRDSVLSYNYNPENIRKVNPFSAVKINGYLLINNKYCISLDINQCSYNNDGTVSEINELEITFIFKKDITSSYKVEEYEIKLPSLNSILNNEAAKRYPDYKPDYNIRDTSDNWINYNQSYSKIKVAKDGIYRISFEDLMESGDNPASINPQSINLFSDGSKIPIYISGEENSLFEPGEYIEFIGIRKLGLDHRKVSLYNSPYNEYLNRYSDTTIYWLTWNESETVRAGISSIVHSAADTVTYYYETVHFENDNWFDYSTDDLVRREHPFWIENKTWGWHAVYPGTSSYKFTLDEIVPNEEAEIYAKFQSYASTVQLKSHLVGIDLNGKSISDSNYVNKYEQKVLNTTFSSNIFQTNNTFSLVSFPTESAVNTIFFDWYEVVYPRKLSLRNDCLIFKLKGDGSQKNIKLENLSEVKYTLWKSDDKFIRYSLPDNLPQSFVFSDSIGNESKYYFLSEKNICKPVIEKSKRFINLRMSRQADYFLITHNAFLPAANEYKNFIEPAYNLNVEVVDVEDIYDEYSFGNFNPESIRDFLITTHTYWTAPLPRYVLLAGDCTYDYHRNKEKNLGVPRSDNFVPSYGSPISDYWFVMWDSTGTYYPYMNIGRLPVKTKEEFYFYLNKHRHYISRKSDDWNKRYLFFSGGNPANPDELFQLKKTNSFIADNIISAVPVGGKSFHFYKTIEPFSNYGPHEPSEILNAIDSSGLFISYLGHSGTQTWDNGIVAPSQLSNRKNRHPLITDFGCSTGKFAEPDVQSFSELFINEGDAIAYIGNSSLGFLSTTLNAPQYFYRQLLSDSVHCISDAHNLSKLQMLKTFGTSVSYNLYSLTSVFLGDPLISLPVPKKPDLTLNSSGVRIAPELPSDNIDSVSLVMDLYNFGMYSGDSANILIEHYFNQTSTSIQKTSIPLPAYFYKLYTAIPVLNQPGEHSIRISLDPDNLIEEIKEDNNSCSFSFYVSDSKLRLLNNYLYESSLKDTLIVLNPNAEPSGIIELEFSRSENFLNSKVLHQAFGRFITAFDLKDKMEPGRWWVRGRIKGEMSYSFTRSFFMNSETDYLLNDSVSYRNSELKNLKISGNYLRPDTCSVQFKVISAGYSDGKTAVISKDGNTYIPAGSLIGHHICVFRDKTFEFIDYKRFNVFGGTLETGEYYKYLDTLSSDYIVLIAVSDEGRVPDSLKRMLHEFGSIYIDSLRFRSSWAFIGKRGAPAGSVPESFSHPFNGKVELDSVISFPFGNGYILTPLIGPAEEWTKIIINNVPESKITPVLIDDYGNSDTLNSTDDWVVSGIDAKLFPFMQLKIDFQNTIKEFSEIPSAGVLYKALPELLTTSAECYLDNDTISLVSEHKLYLNIINAGESVCGKFKVLAELILPDKKTDTLFTRYFDSIHSLESIEWDTTFFPASAGQGFLNISIDVDNEVKEVYEDNNIIRIPVVVIENPAQPDIKIFFDGSEVFDGDFVSTTPEINVRVVNFRGYKLDSSFCTIILDDKKIPFNSLDINYSYSSTDLKFKSNLEEGEHLLEVNIGDSYGIFNSSTVEAVRIIVDKGNKLLSVYNYPNPFSRDTHFTFTLTTVPDELRINIYTITGRLIKRIIKYKSELRTDFNSVYWDGRDEEGDLVSNGVYFYKIISKTAENTSSFIKKLAVIR